MDDVWEVHGWHIDEGKRPESKGVLVRLIKTHRKEKTHTKWEIYNVGYKHISEFLYLHKNDKSKGLI